MNSLPRFYSVRSKVLAMLVLAALVGVPTQALYADTMASSTPAQTTASSSPPAPAQAGSSSATTSAIVATGNASAGSTVEQQTNTNTVQPTSSSATSTPTSTATSTQPVATSTPADTESTTTPSTASSTPETTATTTPTSQVATSTLPSLSGGSTSTSVSANNTASSTNQSSTTAQTGANTATATGGAAGVQTGNAYAAANIINVINTNIIDSTGLLYFANLFSALGIDLRGLNLQYFTGGDASSTCTLITCAGTTTLTTNNSATSTNGVSVVADTGSNLASTTGDGTAAIRTGDAYASANLVNIVNSNILQSNYLLVALNDFGNLPGDIVLPDASFFEQLLAHSAQAALNASVQAQNTAAVANSTAATAQTGTNTASTTGTGSGTVLSGSAAAGATNLNTVNSNEIGNTSIFLLFRVWGNWSGTVQGLPPGLTWQQTPLGIQITNGSGSPVSAQTLAQENTTMVSTTNAAALANKVHVYALTGNNETKAQNGSSTIQTGNAYASANTVNVVNTNLVGHNWIYAIFNIFGNFSGNIAFGRPDLWVGAAAQTGNPTTPGSPVHFTFTVANRGDARATDVRLSADYLAHMLNFTSGSTTPSTATWQLGTLAPGQVRQVVVTADAGSVPQGGSIAVPVDVSVTSAQHDNNPADNSDQVNIIVSNPMDASAGPSFTSAPKLQVTKTADVTATTSPASVNYAVDIQNSGGPAFNAVATDVLRGPDGTVVHRQSWPLGTVAYQDELKLTYTAKFATSTPPGTYTDTTTVTGDMHYPSGASAVAFPSVSTQRTLVILPPASLPECQPYLTSYITPQGPNDPQQVTLLQQFLRTNEGASSVPVDGVYGSSTIAAVKAFQEKYAGQVLAPWGYTAPTGDVYYTTEQTINDIACGGTRSFGLTEAQQNEIAHTKTVIAQLAAASVPSTLPQKSTATGSVAPVTAPTSTAATSSTTSAPALPPSLEVGAAASAPASTSWITALFGGARSLAAGVYGALTQTL